MSATNIGAMGGERAGGCLTSTPSVGGLNPLLGQHNLGVLQTMLFTRRTQNSEHQNIKHPPVHPHTRDHSGGHRKKYVTISPPCPSPKPGHSRNHTHRLLRHVTNT